MKIGIFDSGMGGLSVLLEAQKQMPDVDFIYFGDSYHAPYGTKTVEAVLERSIEICNILLEQGVAGIVVACNTATSAAVVKLRQLFTIPIIGMEPALKPAVENNKGKAIAVMATPMTLKEKKFMRLMEQVCTSQTVYTIPAPKVVELVEKGITSGSDLLSYLVEIFSDYTILDIESVVLGCTHYVFIKEALKQVLGSQITIVDGNYGTIRQLIRKVAYIKTDHKGSITILNTGGQSYIDQSYELLERYKDGN